ncbi:MAG: arylsulfatase [Gemmataceae bacterium]|nr:arylsulfatase [Gemmataceae bacterium]
MTRSLPAVLAAACLASSAAADPPRRPNVVLILADDLGYGDLGSYGQTKIKTPHLDRLAADGVRFTQAYAGSTVCAPSRCALITGLHTGHGRVRGNGGDPKGNAPLRPDDPSVAELLKKAGYATALVGKWGLGEEGSTGVPNRKGFGHFFGYLNQVHAHNYYPDFLWRDGEKVSLPNRPSKVAGVAEKPVAYAPDVLLDDALRFVEANKARPFFLYFATIAPHANNERFKAAGDGNEVPSDAPYTAEDWPQPEKNKAAMITRLDADVGKLLAKLNNSSLERDTVVLFSSDNGPHKEGGNDPAFFRSAGPFRGYKRSLADGGIRVPFVVRWPGVVKPGSVSDHVGAFWDFLPTACDIAGVETPPGRDGVSLLPTLTGKGAQKGHEFLYWEFHEGGSAQAVRHGRWKAIRSAPGRPLELYDVAADPGEAADVAKDHPDIVRRIEAYLATARTDSKEFPVRPAKE